MKKSSNNLVVCLLAFFLGGGALGIYAQGTAFTYQGRLTDGTNPANGLYDFQALLFTNATLGAPLVGVTAANPAVGVTNGIFTMTVQFSLIPVFNNPFNGQALWLDLAVRTNGPGTYSTLTPRQKLTPTPYAIFASAAGSASNYLGTIADSQLSANIPRVNGPADFNVGITAAGFQGDGSQLTGLNAAELIYGTVADYVLSTNVALRNATNNFTASLIATNLNNSFKGSFTGSLAGNGAALTNLNASQLASGTVPDFMLSTNVALRNTTNTFASTNVFAGPVIATNLNNSFKGSFTGSLAGSATSFSGALAGDVTGTQAATVVATVGGQTAANVAAGTGAANAATNTTIPGTIVKRDASGNFSGATITATAFTGSGAGLTNLNASQLTTGTIPLPQLPPAVVTNNSATALTLFGVFSGNGTGLTNVNAAVLGGLSSANYWQLGGNNVTPGQFLGSTNNQALELKVNGARAVRLEPNSSGAPNIIGGSPWNSVSGGAVGATISGGGATNYTGTAYSNIVSVSFGTIAGGAQNTAAGSYGTVGGGIYNAVSNLYTTISGGYSNLASGAYSSVVGGNNNISSGSFSSMGGGTGNQASGIGSTIAGGSGNQASGNYSVIAGGVFNRATNDYSTVAGGLFNFAAGRYSFAAGYLAQAIHDGSFVWADSSGIPFSSTTTNQFKVRATGGVQFETAGGQVLDLSSNGTLQASGPIKASGGLILENRTSDPVTPVTGQIWLRTDL